MTDSVSEKEVFNYMLDKEEEKLKKKEEAINGENNTNSTADKNDGRDSQ